MNDRIEQAGRVLRKNSATAVYSAAGAVLCATLGVLILGAGLAPLCALIGGGAGAFLGAKADLGQSGVRSGSGANGRRERQ